MEDRMKEEISLLKKYFPNLQVSESEDWFLIPEFPLPTAYKWNTPVIQVAFQKPPGYPASPPYGIYILNGLTINDESLDNSVAATNKPPFLGDWTIVSWAIDTVATNWAPKVIVAEGSNLLNFAQSIKDRFNEGK